MLALNCVKKMATCGYKLFLLRSLICECLIFVDICPNLLCQFIRHCVNKIKRINELNKLLVLTLRVLLSHRWWVVMVPVDSVVVGEDYYVALSLPLLGTGHHGWNHQLLQVALKLLTGSVIGQLMEQSTYGQPMTTIREWD